MVITMTTKFEFELIEEIKTKLEKYTSEDNIINCRSRAEGIAKDLFGEDSHHYKP